MRWQGAAIGLALGLLLGAFVGAVFSEPIRRIAFGPSPTPAVDVHAFDALNRAATATEQSLGVGINFQGLSERVQTLATELALAASAARTDREREMIAEYGHALEDYRDSLNVWDRSIQQGAKSVFLPPGMINKYQIPTGYSSTSSDGATIYPVEFVNQQIWIAASAHLRAARLLAIAASVPNPP